MKSSLLMRMTKFQRGVMSIAAALIALRFFLPVQYETRYGPRTDALTTLLHVIGILVVAAAVAVLVPSPEVRRLQRFSPSAVALLVGWLIYLLAGAAGVVRYGIPTSIQAVDWLPTGLALEAFIVLVSLTAVWTGLRATTAPGARRTVQIGVLAGFILSSLLVSGFVGQRYWQQRQSIRVQEQKARTIMESITAQEESINLVRSRLGQQIRAALAGAGEDLNLRGWEVKDLGDRKFLVSYTFRLPEQEVRAVLQKQPFTPFLFLPCARTGLPMVAIAKNSNILGWWWEVWPNEKVIRAVNDTSAGIEKYGLQAIEGQC